MLKGGLLPTPNIIPLSSNSLALKNKIDTETFIEFHSDVSNVRIYFTVDGTNPEPFRAGQSSTNLYRGAFRLGQGRRVIKAIAVTNDGSRESHIATKCFDVNDMYSEDYNDQHSDHEPSLIDHQQCRRNDTFNTKRPISPVSHTGIQVNDWNISRETYQERIPERAPLPPPPPARIIEVTYDEENFWERNPKPITLGNGNWKKTLEHVFLNIYNYVKKEQELREIFGWKKFGRIEKAHLIDKGTTYQIVTTFKKPLGEQTYYEEPLPKSGRKNRRKKRRSHYSDDEKSTRRTRSLTSAERHEKEERRTPRIYTEEIEEQGTLVPFHDFSADSDCEDLRAAMEGAGTDEDMLINILGNRSIDQRLKILDRYKIKFNRDLIVEIKKETSGNFRRILKNLFYSPVEYDCYELQRAIKGLASDEEVLIEILASRSNKRLRAIYDIYPKLYDRTLEQDIMNDTNGHLRKILIALIYNQRPESNEINEHQVEIDAKMLYEAGEKRWGTDESNFIQILSNRSNVQLKAIFQAYQQFSKRDIELAIKSETSGNLQKGLLAIVRIMRNRPGYFAYKLKNALKGSDTDENTLNRVIISRCEIDMIQIKEEYEKLMKRLLEEHIESDTSDDYRNILLELIKDPSRRSRKPKSGTTKKSNKTDIPAYEQPEIYKEEIIQQGTMIAASNFDANRDVDALRKAMKGVGTNEKTLIQILGNRNTKQRLEIKSAFKKNLNRDLLADLKSETSGNFGKLLELLMMDPVELDCFELKQAVKGAGTDEEALIEILASRSNERIRLINETYKKMFSKPLEKDIKSDTSGDFRRLLVALMQGRRPETSDVNLEEVKRDAQSLIDAGPEKFSGDEARFNNLFCERSDSELRAIFQKFAELTGKTIEEMAEKETKRDHQKAILAVLRCIKSRPQFFAEQLQKSMKGLGTREETLNRIIITRSEIDLVQIKEVYKHKFKRELEKDVISDTSSDYQKLLLEILKDPSQRN